MSARSPALEQLENLQRQVGELVRAQRQKDRTAGRRRGSQLAYSQGPMPGPKPSDLDVARAKRVWRGAR